MSLARFVYHSAVLSGWAALAAWVVAECLVLRGSMPGAAATAIVGAVLGAAISAGLQWTSGANNPRWARQARRLSLGLIGGGIGGASGALLGELLYSHANLPRSLGWMTMGILIGAVDGLADGSGSKLRHGLIGGGLGGLAGGWLFDRIAVPDAEMAARATAFVIMGVPIGALVGVAQVALKRAWLTVLDGFGPGRQLILSQPVTVLGRGDHLALPFLGHSARELDSEHLRIARQADGRFTLEDTGTRIGTFLNGRRVAGPVTLRDGDLIRLGGNIVRFNLRQGISRAAEAVVDGPAPADAAPGEGPPGSPDRRIAPPPPPGLPSRRKPSGPGPAPTGDQPRPPLSGPAIPPPPPPPEPGG